MAKAMRFMAGMALSLALAAPALAQDPTADTVIATVNGTNITLGQHDRRARKPARSV